MNFEFFSCSRIMKRNLRTWTRKRFWKVGRNMDKNWEITATRSINLKNIQNGAMISKMSACCWNYSHQQPKVKHCNPFISRLTSWLSSTWYVHLFVLWITYSLLKWDCYSTENFECFLFHLQGRNCTKKYDETGERSSVHRGIWVV